MPVWRNHDTGSKGAKGQLSRDTPLILARISSAGKHPVFTHTLPHTHVPHTNNSAFQFCSFMKHLGPVINMKYKKEVNKRSGLSRVSCTPKDFLLKAAPESVCCLDLALSGPVHRASVWNDVEGQTGDCGC